MKAPSHLSPGTPCGAFVISSLVLPALIEGRLADGPWYRAVDSKRRDHLLQEVITPSPSAPWWDVYVTYQHEIRRRLAESPSALAAAGGWQSVFVTTEPARQTWRAFLDETECIGLADEEWLSSLPEADRAPRTVAGATGRLAVARAFWEALGAVHRAGVILGLTAPGAIGAALLAGGGARVRFYDWQWSALPDVPPPWTAELFRQAAARSALASPGQRRAELPTPADDLYFAARLSLQLLAGPAETSPLAAFQALEPSVIESAGLDLSALELALSACLRATSSASAAGPTQVTGPASTLPSAGRIALLFAGKTAAPRQTALVAHAAHPVRPKLETKPASVRVPTSLSVRRKPTERPPKTGRMK